VPLPGRAGASDLGGACARSRGCCARRACPAPSGESMWSVDQQQASASTASARSATPNARTSSLQPLVGPFYRRWRLRPAQTPLRRDTRFEPHAPAPSSRAVLSRWTNLSSRWIVANAGMRLLPLAHCDTPGSTLGAVANRRLRKRRPCQRTGRGWSARPRSAYADSGTGGAWPVAVQSASQGLPPRRSISRSGLKP
jgi:hypothetical protein